MKEQEIELINRPDKEQYLETLLEDYKKQYVHKEIQLKALRPVATLSNSPEIVKVIKAMEGDLANTKKIIQVAREELLAIKETLTKGKQ